MPRPTPSLSWNSGINSDTGRPIWVATAHFDKGFKRTSALVPVHSIDPSIDQQREYVRHDLEAGGTVESLTRLPVTGQLTGRTSRAIASSPTEPRVCSS